MADTVAGQFSGGLFGFNWLVWVALIALIIFVICTPWWV